MNEIIMWIINAVVNVIGFVVKYVGLGILIIGAMSFIWPYIAGIVKFFAVAIPAVLAFILFRSGEILMALGVIVGAALVLCLVWMLFRALDDWFGVLETDDFI